MLLKKLLPLFFVPILALSGVLLGVTLSTPGARLPENTASYPLRIEGEYSLNQSALWQPFTSDTKIPADQMRRVTVRGHFTREVKPGEQLVMHISNLQMTLWVNGREIFAFGGDSQTSVKGPGVVWTAFTTSGIQPEDQLTLTLANVYTNEALSSFDDFFQSLSGGSEYRVYRTAVFAQGGAMLIAAAVTLLGLCMLIISLYARVLRIVRAGDYVYLSAFVIVSGLWMGVNYQVVSLILPYPGFYHTLEMLCMALMPVFLMAYMLPLASKPHRPFCFAVILLELTAALTGILLQLFRVTDLPALTGYFAITDVFGILVYALCLSKTLLQNSGKETRSAILPLFVLFIGALLNLANFFFGWRTNGMFYAAAFLGFSLWEMVRLIYLFREYVRRSREYAQLENELTQSRIAVMLSQIKPHFLFNALNSISALCLTDPLMADQAITSLSNYLRGNIRSLEQSSPIPFEQELDHIKYYVRLEQLRYGDKLRVVYAIHTTDFQVPTLSLQTLVENAIRHGVSPKPEGGLVVVETERGDHCTFVRIIDNGVGFDMDLRSRNADSIGLANAKKRMEAMMNAEFSIQSTPGKGTNVTIRIPDAPERKKA